MISWQVKYLLFSYFFFCLAVPAGAAVVTLSNGDQLSGTIIGENEQEITLRHEVLGILTIPRSKLQSKAKKDREQNNRETEAVPPEPTPAGTKKASRQPKKTSPEKSRLFGFDFFEGWTHHLAAGIKGEEGNDVSMDSNVAYDAAFHDQAHRMVLSSAYYYETKDRDKDTNKGHINFVRDWLLPESEWFYYSYLRYEYDSFKSWKHRISLSGGCGYDFYRRENFELSGRVGLGGSRTWGTENDYAPEGLIGFEWTWKPLQPENHTLTAEFIVYPDLDDAGEYRTWAQGKWRIDFSSLRGFGIELGFEHEYESTIKDKLENEKHYDLIYFGRFGVDF